jgi:hypothetical protein
VTQPRLPAGSFPSDPHCEWRPSRRSVQGGRDPGLRRDPGGTRGGHLPPRRPSRSGAFRGEASGMCRASPVSAPQAPRPRCRTAWTPRPAATGTDARFARFAAARARLDVPPPLTVAQARVCERHCLPAHLELTRALGPGLDGRTCPSRRSPMPGRAHVSRSPEERRDPGHPPAYDDGRPPTARLRLECSVGQFQEGDRSGSRPAGRRGKIIR